MDLLPKNHDQFRQTDYWDSFFKKRGRAAFEWYGEYAELCGILHKYIKPTDDVLVVGCGNSSLSADLFDVGYAKLTSIDLSAVVIKQMKQQHQRVRPGLKFMEMDVTDMHADFPADSFSCVLDKGTLDAMFTDNTDEVKEKVNQMFSEIDRVLRFGGRYICISLLQPHILEYVVTRFSERSWPVRILRCKEAEAGRAPQDKIFPVFAVVATKFKKMPNMPQVLEMCLSAEGQTNRLKKPEDLINSVRGIQQFAAVRAGAAKGKKLFDTDARQEDVSLELKGPDSDKPKYSLFLVDRDKPSNSKFAVFIVPQGRETEWLFSTSEGRSQLAATASSQRLVVVHLQRSHTFASLTAIQAEISGYVMELAPSDLPANASVPFLSIGEHDTVGARAERCRGVSDFSGEYVVEDVQVDQSIYRRLVFMNNSNLTQSEAKVKVDKSKNKKGRKVVDHNYLACAHHSQMISALGHFMDVEPVRCLLVGLGGGALAMHMVRNFPKVHLDVVELDPAIERVAKEQFDFQESDRLKVHIADGLDFINNKDSSSARYHIILFDVDSKDSAVGMSCPPKPFVQKEFLAEMKERCLEQKGMFVLNLVCRDPALRDSVTSLLKDLFGGVLSFQVPEEVNEILFCSDSLTNPGRKRRVDAKHPAIEAVRAVNAAVEAATEEKDFIDISEALKRLNFVV